MVELAVFWGVERVGLLQRSPVTVQIAFAYDPQWLATPQRFAVSASLPLADGWNHAPAAGAFFCNLLPEGAVRAAIARQLQISPGNDFALLAAIGGECAGALSVLPVDQGPTHQQDLYEPLAPETIEQMAKRYDVFAEVAAHRKARLSLAGAQDKLPVRLDPDGSFWLSVQGAPSTHILKFPSRKFKHLAANEVLSIGLAARMGLPVVDARLVRIGDVEVAVIARYDRIRHGQIISRLHQEDMCQALGLMPSVKYESEGGPSLADVAGVVRAQSHQPLEDVQHLITWVTFNLLLTNADGHGKNLSLLHQKGCWLAPFYDVLCTSVYPSIDRSLAMSIGGEKDPGKISGSHWKRLAGQLAIGERFILDQVHAMANTLPSRFDEVARDYAGQHGPTPIIERIKTSLRKQCRRTLTLLKSR